MNLECNGQKNLFASIQNYVDVENYAHEIYKWLEQLLFTGINKFFQHRTIQILFQLKSHAFIFNYSILKSGHAFCFAL